MLYGAQGEVAAAPEWQDLATKIAKGDGLMWPGDERMYLQIGVLEGRSQFGRVITTGRRLEVWRLNEDGSETLVAHWRPEEQFRVCMDLAEMRVEAPGHVDVLDRIDAHNDALEEKASQQWRESTAEMLEHALKVHHDLNEPRNTFYMGGDPNRGGRA